MSTVLDLFGTLGNSGFEVGAIRQLLDFTDQLDRSCAEADVIARVHIREIDSKIAG